MLQFVSKPARPRQNRRNSTAALTDARRVILEALRSAGAEHTRLNPPDPEEEPDDPAHA